MKTFAHESALAALTAMSDELLRAVAIARTAGLRHFDLALSGGDTAKKIFGIWRHEYAETIDWDFIRFYWVDERCVPPQDLQSNFGAADELLFAPLGIKESRIFRIRGEDDPEKEAARYSNLVKKNLAELRAYPSFDCAILGVGADLHTASIFPNCMGLLSDPRPYAVSQNPYDASVRVGMTGTLILNSKLILAAVLGKEKRDVIKSLATPQDTMPLKPASYVLSAAPNAMLFTDAKL